MVNQQKAIEEALERMKVLKLHPNVIREFKNERKLNLTEPWGALYWLNEEQDKMVKEFEKKTCAIVYHVIRSNTTIGEMYSLLYISKHEEEWEMDREDLSAGQVFAYVINKTIPDFSEYGTIGIKPFIGGVVRTY